MKKLISLILAAVLALALFTACGGSEPVTSESPQAAAAPAETVAPETAAPDTQAQAAYEIISKKATTWVNSIGTPWVQTIIEIENTGSVNLFMNSCSYDLEDASGSLVAAHKMVNCFPQILAPGENGVIYHETMLDAPVDGELTVLPHEDIEEAKVDMVRLPVSDFSLSDDQYLGVNMIGRVENNTSEELTMVYVAAIYYGEDGSCIGCDFTILDKISAGDKIGFESSAMSMPDTVKAADVASYEVFAYTYQFQF